MNTALHTRAISISHASGWSLPALIVFSVLMLMYAVVFVYSSRSLFRPHARVDNRISLFCATLFLFITTLAMYGIFILGWQSSSTPFLSTIWTILFAINIVVGDAILAWRVCVIWKWKKAVTITSAFLLFAVAALWAFAIIIDFLPASSPPSFVASAWFTGAVAWRSLQHRRLFKNSRVPKFAAFVELGVAYTVLWALFLVMTYITVDFVFRWLEIIMIVTVGLHPTLVVAFVARQKTPLADQVTSIEALDTSDQIAFADKWEDTA